MILCEKDHQEAFVSWKRSGCFVHTLQLVVKVLETAPAYFRGVNSALAIVKKLNKPCRATERLLQEYTKCQKILETIKGINSSFVSNSPKDQMSFLMHCSYCQDTFNFFISNSESALYFFLLVPAYRIQSSNA